MARLIHTSSSLLFLLPAAYAFMTGEVVFGMLAVLMTIVSTAYHIVKPKGPHWWGDKTKTTLQNSMLFLDTFVAIVLFMYGVYLFYKAGFPLLFFAAFILFIPLLIQFMFPTRAYYVLQHAVWHVGSAFVMFLPLL